MKVIKATQQMLETRTLVLGFQGENLRTQLRIDCAATFAEYPNATPALAIKPPAGETYPVFVERDGTEVVWDIVANNLVLKGDGELQLTFYKDNVIAKTSIGHITVNRSLQIDGEMPDVVATWIENANRKLAEVDAQIVELEGMVDTATDAATRAEQSASTASTKAEQAAGSAATATAKATEATQAAGTATTKATEATEAAQTATEKAGDASASATAAQTSATNAASSATAASASETAAKASETSAGASATQAAQSVLDAGANAQTATQKAAEAAQSANNAAASATNAATSAETASTKAGEAAQSAQAVEQTAEQLEDSLEQIDQNTQDIADLDERKANIDGYYPDMTVGNAEQLNSSKYVENSEPYTLRTSGGTSDIGNREYLDAVVGGTLAWNQTVRDEASENSTDFADIVTVTDAVEDAAGVKVKIEPVQDLHGYDHPWPAGGGKNLLPKGGTSSTYQGVTVSYDSENEIYTLNGTVNSVATIYLALPRVKSMTLSPDKKYSISCRVVSGSFVLGEDSSTTNTYAVACFSKNLSNYFRGALSLPESSLDGYSGYGSGFDTESYYCVLVQCWKVGTVFNNLKIKIQIEEGQTATEWTPYSNICPITGWDGVKVSRTGINAWDEDWESGFFSYSGVKSNSSTAIRSKNFCVCAPGTIYYAFCGNATSDLYVLWYDATQNFIVRQNAKNTRVKSPENAHYFKVSTSPNYQETYGHDISLNYPATDTEYHPGNIQTVDITLPTEAGTVYGGTLTVNADGSGSLVVDLNEIVFDGVTNRLNVASNSHILSSYTRGYLSVTSINADPNRRTEVVCDFFPTSTNQEINVLRPVAQGSRLELNFYIANNLTGIVYGEDTSATAMTKINNWLKNNLVKVLYPLTTPITYTLTASQIRTLLGQNHIWSDAGQTALTYTGTDEHITLEGGKKYLSRISGTDSMLLGSGQEITAAKGTDNVFDLTQMFGTAVADYVYGQGAAFFRKWFPGARYPYNAGELRHVEGLQSHDMVGFNLFDAEAVLVPLGFVKQSDGSLYLGRASDVQTATVLWANKAQYDGTICISYEYKNNSGATSGGARFRFDYVDGTYSYSYPSPVATYTAYRIVSITGKKVKQITYDFGSGITSTWLKNVCVNFSHNNSRNGEYAPYEKHSYPLDSSVILRGIPKVGANGVYWDGDRYLPDGTVERRYGVVDLGTLTWAYEGGNITGSTLPIGQFRATTDSILKTFKWHGNIIAPKKYINKENGAWSNMSEGYIAVTNSQDVPQLRIVDSNYTDAESFKSAMSGFLIVYELATPTTETAQPYHSTQWVSDWGTEEFVSTGLVPVGHETRYPANLRDKLQHLPDAASGNGSYLITQTDGQMTLTPFPAPPSTAGNYVLKATVVNGVATYTWEVAT